MMPQDNATNEVYRRASAEVFGSSLPVPGVELSTSFELNSFWGDRFYNAMTSVQLDIVDTLIRDISKKNVRGDFAEFGIFEGFWINELYKRTRDIGLERPIYGFDSFAGLSKPGDFDDPFWQEGQFAASFEFVQQNVKLKERPAIKLIKGFFSESLISNESQSINELAFTRIDCDIYEPAVQCLSFLSHRLADQSILVFDDWPHRHDIGEARAFFESVPSVPHLKFEFLFYGPLGHLYLKVHKIF